MLDLPVLTIVFGFGLSQSTINTVQNSSNVMKQSDIVISGLVIQDYEGGISPESNSEEIVNESSDDSSINN